MYGDMNGFRSKNHGSIQNVCTICKNKIQVRRPKDVFLAASLQNSKNAVCNICDPNSSWKRVTIPVIIEITSSRKEKSESQKNNYIHENLLSLNDVNKKGINKVADKKDIEVNISEIERFIKELRDTRLIIRERAFKMLINIGNSSVDSLIQALDDNNKHIRKKIIEILGEIGNKKAVEPLIKLSKDPDPEVRWSVVYSLEKIRDPMTVSFFIQLIRDGEISTRRLAIKA